MRYLHEYSPGDTIALGSSMLPQDEIDAFSERYDPQPQYVDDSLAGPLHGGRIASPWQAASLAQSLFVRECLNLTADLGVSEIRAVQYETPLRADSTVHGELTINSIVDAPEQQDRGLIDADIVLYDDADCIVLRQNVVFAVARKPRH